MLDRTIVVKQNAKHHKLAVAEPTYNQDEDTFTWTGGEGVSDFLVDFASGEWPFLGDQVTIHPDTEMTIDSSKPKAIYKYTISGHYTAQSGAAPVPFSEDPHIIVNDGNSGLHNPFSTSEPGLISAITQTTLQGIATAIKASRKDKQESKFLFPSGIHSIELDIKLGPEIKIKINGTKSDN